MTFTQVSRHDFQDSVVYVLSNSSNMQVELCSFGASILRILSPDLHGTLKNIALSYESRANYLASGSHAGATIGPVAGRLQGGILELLGTQYLLTRNDGANTLHGGQHGLSQIDWQVTSYGNSHVIFCCHLPDGLDGFPGNRKISVCYTLDEQNCLTIDYTAETDRATFLNLTNHTYWNLSGDFSADAYAHLLEIAADVVFYNDTAHLPMESHSVHNTAFDFCHIRTLKQAMAEDSQNPQLKIARGYNNAYLLHPFSKFAARLTNPASGRRVTLRTDYPALVFYSGGYLPVSGCAIALEAQYLPNTSHPPLLPNQIYHHYISFTLDTIRIQTT